MERPAHLVVHCFAYNRPANFKRMWESLMATVPTAGLATSVVIHVEHDDDGGESWRQQVEMVQSYARPGRCAVGPVSAVFGTKNKGLRASMLEAWAPVPHEYAMFLEDDIEVAPMLLLAAEAFVNAYGETGNRSAPDDNILGYKLYNQKWDEVNQRDERPVNNNNLPFKLQEPCSWGTVFAPRPYARYLAWYAANSRWDPFIPRAWSNMWDAERSAKKYLQRFMWEEAMYLVAVNLPDHISLTTPRLEAGTNIKVQWLDFLKKRLEVPLLTQSVADDLRRKGIDPFATPPADELWVYNPQHERVGAATPPPPELLQLFHHGAVPPASIFDPSPKLKARCVPHSATSQTHNLLSFIPIFLFLPRPPPTLSQPSSLIP